MSAARPFGARIAVLIIVAALTDPLVAGHSEAWVETALTSAAVTPSERARVMTLFAQFKQEVAGIAAKFDDEEQAIASHYPRTAEAEKRVIRARCNAALAAARRNFEVSATKLLGSSAAPIWRSRCQDLRRETCLDALRESTGESVYFDLIVSLEAIRPLGEHAPAIRIVADTYRMQMDHLLHRWELRSRLAGAEATLESIRALERGARPDVAKQRSRGREMLKIFRDVAHENANSVKMVAGAADSQTEAAFLERVARALIPDFFRPTPVELFIGELQRPDCSVGATLVRRLLDVYDEYSLDLQAARRALTIAQLDWWMNAPDARADARVSIVEELRRLEDDTLATIDAALSVSDRTKLTGPARLALSLAPSSHSTP